uniref:Uncharacterized protein n=1 Tax=Xiphophorus couchianus TaxID=32473 RepID=A0A3B5L941_9TELE
RESDAAVALCERCVSIFLCSNVLSTARLGCKLDLNFIARNKWNCEYNPKVNELQIIRKPRSTARLFRNGTLVCAGAKSIDESHRAARKFARIVQKLNFPVRLLNFQIKNILSCGKFFPVHLADVRQAYNKECRSGQLFMSSNVQCLHSHVTLQVTL